MAMEPPIKPNVDDCCNSGCNPCVFDVYEKQMLLYQKFIKNKESSHALPRNAISQLNYTNFTVVNSIKLSDNHVLVVFKLSQNSDETSSVWWKPGQHFLVKYSNISVSCTRAYTPLKIGSHVDCQFDFMIIVKKYDFGIVSPYLYSLSHGNITQWRGPYGSYEYYANCFQRVIMIGHGTGITPFYTIIKSILNNEEDFTKILLFYCCKKIDEILLRNELYSFRAFWNFSYKIFLGVPNIHTVKYQEPILNHKLSKVDITNLGPFTAKDQFLLCGSSEFVTQYYSLLVNSGNVEENNVVTF